MQVTIEGLKSFTVDGKEYDFLPLDEWELNDCCLFEEVAGVQFEELLGAGVLSPRNLRAAMYVVAKHHGLDISLEDAGAVKMMAFMEAVAGEAIADAAAAVAKDGGKKSPPAKAAAKGRKTHARSSSRSRK